MPLQLKGYTIDRLSGPIEAHLLQPKREYKRQLPIFFLLGDRHNSMTQLCKNCECKGPGDPNCCLEVFSDTFLGLLDQLAQDRKVSFYTEFFEPKKEKELWLRRPEFFSKQLDKRLATPPKGVMQMLRERLVACYLDTQMKKKNGTGEDGLQRYCPTSLLDWEYSDLRQINTNASIEELIDTEPYFYEAILFRALYFIFLQFDSEDDPPVLDEMFNVVSIAKRLGPDRARDFFYSLSLLLKSPTDFSKWFFSESNTLTSVSLLHNLVKKIKIFTPSDIENWMNFQLQHYTHQGSWYDSVTKKWSDYFGQLAQGKMVLMPSGKPKPKEPIVFVDLCLPFLDLYFLLHSFSKTKGSFTASGDKGLSIGYFGSTHIQGIVDLLINKLQLYTRVSNKVKGKNGEERCLVLDEIDWDIESVLEESISGPTAPISIPKGSFVTLPPPALDGKVPVGRILQTNKVLRSVRSPKRKKKTRL